MFEDPEGVAKAAVAKQAGPSANDAVNSVLRVLRKALVRLPGGCGARAACCARCCCWCWRLRAGFTAPKALLPLLPGQRTTLPASCKSVPHSRVC